MELARFHLDASGSLYRSDCVNPVMRNHPDEMDCYREFLANASGDVLLLGLGIGLMIPSLIVKHGVRSVTVVEKFQEVIDLVPVPPSVLVLHGDAWEWVPPCEYNTILVDITFFPEQSDPSEGYTLEALIERYREWLTPGGWIGGRNP